MLGLDLFDPFQGLGLLVVYRIMFLRNFLKTNPPYLSGGIPRFDLRLIMEDLECLRLISLRRFLNRAWEKRPDAQDG